MKLGKQFLGEAVELGLALVHAYLEAAGGDFQGPRPNGAGSNCRRTMQNVVCKKGERAPVTGSTSEIFSPCSPGCKDKHP